MEVLQVQASEAGKLHFLPHGSVTRLRQRETADLMTSTRRGRQESGRRQQLVLLLYHHLEAGCQTIRTPRKKEQGDP